MRLVAPAACASDQKRSYPYASRMEAYVIGMSGTSTRAADLRQALEAGPGAHAARQRPLAREPDHGPVRERVGEGEADLEQVGAARDRRLRQLGRLRERHQVDGEPLAHRKGSQVMAEHDAEVLVPAAREPDEDHVAVEVERARERVRGLERGDDPFALGQQVEGGERLLVGRGHVLGPAGVAQEGVLGADARVVEARPRSSARRRSARPRRRGSRSVRRAGRRRGPSPRLAAPAASTPTRRTPSSSRKPAKSPIAFEPPPTHATTASGKPALRVQDLLARLPSDHGLELAHDLRVGVRADARADQVVGRLDVRDPVADRLARGLLERPGAELDRAHLGAEQVHALDVRALPLHVLGAHVDDAVEPEARADGRGGDPVLARARLGDDPLLAEPARDERLPDRVVDLVRARVAEVLALQVDPLRRPPSRSAR